MTIPSDYKRNTSGGAFTSTSEKIGGVVIGITSATTVTAGQPVTLVFDLKAQGINEHGFPRRSLPKDTASTIEAKGAGTGTFAYDQVAWMLRGNQSSNKINNVANTSLQINGNERIDRERSSLTPIGAKTSTAWRGNLFNPLGVSEKRTPWDGGIAAVNPMNAANYQDAVGGVTTADNAVGTRAIPGELAYMFGSLVANTGEYSAMTGS